MHFSESTLSAYPLLTVSKPQKEYFLNFLFKGLHTASGRLVDIIHTCHGPLQKQPLTFNCLSQRSDSFLKNYHH